MSTDSYDMDGALPPDWSAVTKRYLDYGEWDEKRYGPMPIDPDTRVPADVRAAFKIKIDPDWAKSPKPNGRNDHQSPDQAPQGNGSAEQTGGRDDGYISQIRAAMLDYGIAYPPATFVADGRWHRFDPDGGRGDAGSYILRDHGYVTVCTYIDHRCADGHQTVKINLGRKLSPEEMREYRRQAKEQQSRADAELKAEQERVAAEAQARWDAAREVTSTDKHAYLARKKVQPHGLRIEGQMLLVPVRDINGKLWTLQTIPPDADKRFLLGGRALGGMHMIGDVGSGDTFCLAEGYATASTIFEATGHPVICCFSADNLVHVAPLLRQKYPSARIIIGGDDDWMAREGKPRIAKENKGRIRAIEATKAIGGILALPWFDKGRPHKATDFNDQAALHGTDSVKFSIDEAIRCFEEETERQQKAEKRADGDGAAPPEEHVTDDDTGDDDIQTAADDEEIKATRKGIKDKLNAAVDKMNEKYCVVNDGGSVLIFQDRFDDALKRRVYDRMRPSGFTLLHSNEQICTSISPEGKRTYKPIAPVWLKDKRRRDYKNGVVFDPTTTGSRDGFLNLWRGFGYAPKRGKWEKMKEHLHKIVCSGNDEYFDYLMGWMACAIRRPADQGEVAVVMRGGQGVGKGILGHALRKLFGQHGMYISKSKHLVGAFNAHLRDCVILFADEAFFAGDKPAEGTLKSLITEETLTIEPKGQNVILCKNHLHIVMASNEKWVIPAGLDERRFFVLDVPNTHKRDLPYFKNIIRELESGGYAAMLYEFLNYDISNFDVRRVPGTAALQEQKKLTLSLELKWWHDVLSRGYVYRSKYGLEAHFGQWHEFMSTDVLFDAYMDFARSRNDRYPMSRVLFGKFMIEMGSKSSRPSGTDAIGEHQVRSNYDGILRAEVITKDRPHGYRLGTLDQARQAFEEHTSMTFTWEPDDE